MIYLLVLRLNSRDVTLVTHAESGVVGKSWALNYIKYGRSFSN